MEAFAERMQSVGRGRAKISDSSEHWLSHLWVCIKIWKVPTKVEVRHTMCIHYAAEVAWRLHSPWHKNMSLQAERFPRSFLLSALIVNIYFFFPTSIFFSPTTEAPFLTTACVRQWSPPQIPTRSPTAVLERSWETNQAHQRPSKRL